MQITTKSAKSTRFLGGFAAMPGERDRRGRPSRRHAGWRWMKDDSDMILVFPGRADAKRVASALALESGLIYHYCMSSVHEIETAVSKLSRQELLAFRDWFSEFDAAA